MWRSLFLDDDGGAGGGAPTITVEVDGKSVEVPAPKGWLPESAVKEKYVPVGAHNAEMAKMRRQLDETKGLKNPDDLLEDPEYRATAIKRWGLDPNATQEQWQKQLEEERSRIRSRDIEPLEKKLGKATETIASLRARDLTSQILSAASAAKVDDKLLKAPAKGAKPLIVSMLEPLFAYDDEHGEWWARGSGDARFQFSGSSETPYMGVLEFVNTWAAGDGKDYLRDQRQAGPGAQVNGDGTAGIVGRELRVTKAQMQDPIAAKKLIERAEKEHLTLVRID